MNTGTVAKELKVSICQKCNGWVRAMALEYFLSNLKARNEFMKEVAKHNLSVNQFTLSQWQELELQMCKCK